MIMIILIMMMIIMMISKYLNEKVGFIIPTTRTRTFSKSARRFSEVVRFNSVVGWGLEFFRSGLGYKRGLNWHDL